MCKVQSISVEGAVLVGRRGNAYWFITGIYRGKPGEFECRGLAAYPVSKEHAEASWNEDSLEERFDAAYPEYANDWIREDCYNCGDGADWDGCSDCGYDSFREWCKDLAKCDGYDAIFDSPGGSIIHILQLYLDPDGSNGSVEFADTAYRGNIFGDDVSLDGPNGFDEFYNRAALEAAIEYHEGRIDYNAAKDAIYTDQTG